MGQIRPVVTDDRDAIVAMMTRAFHDDPGMVIIEPEESLRDAAATALFYGFVTASLTEATAAEAIGSPAVGAAFWYGPSAHGPSSAALAAAAAEPGAPIVGTRALARFVGLVGELESLRVRQMADEPHLRLDFLAVDQATQGHGLGGDLVESGNAIADERGLPIYLDTLTAANVRFYGHHGFRVLEEYPVPATPHRIWAMRRG